MSKPLKRLNGETTVLLQKPSTVSHAISALASKEPHPKDFIDGMTALTDEIETDRALLKIFARVAKRGKYQTLSAADIPKMQQMAIKFETKLKGQLRVNDGKIMIENKKDLRIFSYILNDFFKRGEWSGDYYAPTAENLCKHDNSILLF